MEINNQNFWIHFFWSTTLKSFKIISQTFVHMSSQLGRAWIFSFVSREFSSTEYHWFIYNMTKQFMALLQMGINCKSPWSNWSHLFIITVYFQLNHFPGSFQIGRKDRLWRNLLKMQVHFGKKEFGFFPQTFVLPADSKQLKRAWEDGGNKQKWIIKPVRSEN